MSAMRKLITELRNNPKNVRFVTLKKVCDAHFGPSRSSSGSHHVYKTPWQGDPRVNIQRSKDGKAKAYQVRQVLKAIKKLEGETNE